MAGASKGWPSCLNHNLGLAMATAAWVGAVLMGQSGGKGGKHWTAEQRKFNKYARTERERKKVGANDLAAAATTPVPLR